MIIFDVVVEGKIERATLLMTKEEALELIEKVAYLIRDPKYHHDHLESGDGILDLVVVGQASLDSYSESLRPFVERLMLRDEPELHQDS